MGDTVEEEEEDLYSDLPNFKYDETVDKLQADNKELQARVVFLEGEIEKQTKELDGIRSQCETLTKNISSLLKTAQNEIKRKDNKINELNKMVLELKTEILTLKKRKYDSMMPVHNEEPAPKQQKLDNTSSVKSAISQFFCNPEIIKKATNLEESEVSKIDISEKPHAPDIKCHTLYSQRMYNKIYSIGNLESNVKKQKVENKNSDEVDMKNVVEVNMNTKLGDKNVFLPNLESPKERGCNEQLDQSTSNLRETETIVKPFKNSNNATSIKNSKPLFNAFRNESLNIDSKKACLEPTSCDIDRKQIILVSGSKYIELNKEVNTRCSETSPRIEKSSSDNLYDETVKNNTCSQDNKRSVITRTNRSANFSSNEKFSKDVYIKHYTQNSKISSIVNKDKVSKMEDLNASQKTDILSNKNHGHKNEKLITNSKENVNSHFAKSYCLKKSKKSIKSVICPISGEWAKNNEALPLGKAMEMDVSKRASPNSKTGKEDLDIIESLFGSPLKWTENSIDEGKQLEKLSPPATAFEDSCSAHIENLKFKETRNNVTEVSETKITELSLTKKFSYTERKCYFQPSVTEVDNELPKVEIESKSDISLSKDILKQSNITHWPFKKTNNDIPSKRRTVTSPTFSSFVSIESTSEACDVPSSLKSNPNTLDLVNPSTKFSRLPKYNDSVLGQFDDTTQLINALAKDPSKLSPIHTPIKETKSDYTNSTTQTQSIENCGIKPSTVSVDKNVLVLSNNEKNKLTHKEPTSSVNEKESVSVPKDSLTVKKPFKSNIVDKKMSVSKPLISTVEKKLSIPASVISSVEKKLSFPFSVLSPVDKKIEKKTILLEQPINILCPRKTPRQIGSCKQNILSKKPNVVKNINKNNQDELCFIKSPSPVKEKLSKTESRSTQENDVLGCSKNLDYDDSDLKNHTISNNISSKLESIRNSKSSTNIFEKYKRTDTKNVSSSLVSKDRRTIPEKTLIKKDLSPVKEKIKHSCSRKENVPQRREQKLPSIKENSPFKFRRDQRQDRRDFMQEVFKRPLSRRESFKRPNCYFRQSSVERKIAKDWRHSAKTRNFPVKTRDVCESTRTINLTGNKSTFSTKMVDPKLRQSPCYPTKTPVISRSSRISWSSSTGVVSTKPSKVQPNNEFTKAAPPEMKWILRPIDFDESPSNILKESSLTSVPEAGINNLVSSSKSETETETPVSKFLQCTGSPLISPERNSPGKSIVIVAKRRPIKFGSNN
ncbi:uncharacterized protein [Halyomorpha halys]|uniref:uncharacterized protein n=1 Tax=Halyomorpha halys TaxID=286706 RepID=UPI0006D4C7C8|nr:uncharacterized protein LOC106688412 [Halyomorpha halys]